MCLLLLTTVATSEFFFFLRATHHLECVAAITGLVPTGTRDELQCQSWTNLSGLGSPTGSGLCVRSPLTQCVSQLTGVNYSQCGHFSGFHRVVKTMSLEYCHVTALAHMEAQLWWWTVNSSLQISSNHVLEVCQLLHRSQQSVVYGVIVCQQRAHSRYETVSLVCL